MTSLEHRNKNPGVPEGNRGLGGVLSRVHKVSNPGEAFGLCQGREK